MNRRILRIALILLPLLFSFGSIYAKGPPARITIEGPGISEVLEISDEVLLQPFGWGEFVDFSSPVEARNDIERGYIITRYVLIGGTTMRSLDTFTYFPGSANEESIVFYKGIIDKNLILGGSPHDGKWFRVSTDGESAIQRIFDAHGISKRENPPSNLSISMKIPVWVRYGFILAVTGIAIFLFASQLKRLRRVKQE
ncbi:MAG: hypothetical protein ACE5E7_19075 [Anaerolineae bacterium]